MTTWFVRYSYYTGSNEKLVGTNFVKLDEWDDEKVVKVLMANHDDGCRFNDYEFVSFVQKDNVYHQSRLNPRLVHTV